MRVFLLACALPFALGCDARGPTSTRTTSAKFQTLPERIIFLNQYVTFRRNYETLDFDIFYENNSGGVLPGPSDWDIRLVATVPAAEIAAWIPAGVKSRIALPSDPAWLKSIPTSADLSGIDEWYIDGSRTIGLDRGRRIVAYRVTTNPN